jgi:phytoene dehydrogenase-like protein
MLEHSIDATVATLNDCDHASYRSLVAPLASRFAELAEDILRPVLHFPHHPLLLARFGSAAVLSAASLASSRFAGKRAQAFFAGMATHSVLSLEAPASAAVGLILIAAGHASGWPILRGGAQVLTDALARYFNDLGGSIEINHEVTQLPGADLVLAGITPRQLIRIAGPLLPQDYRLRLQRFRYGAGAFKIDYALSAPIPWTALECSRAATVHVGGTLEEIVESERSFTSDRPFVLVGQPSLFDPSRSPVGRHTAWAYCHVPNGSTKDYTEAIERQIARFAPDFRDCILSRSVSPPAALEQWNPNLIGGDFLGGAMDMRQILFRPTRSLYRARRGKLYLCGASTPPGGGVHGMSGYHAAIMALRELTR